MAMVKPSFSVPAELLADLDYISRRIGVSRSALLTELLLDTLGNLRFILEDVPENPTEQDVLRFRGRSMGLIESRIVNLKELEHDMFAKHRY